MSVRERILVIRLLEKMRTEKEFCDKLGLEDASRFRTESSKKSVIERR